MRKLLPLYFALTLLLVTSAYAQQRQLIQENSPSERRIALVIGNSAYETAPLKNPVNDAQDMAKALEGLGFEIVNKDKMFNLNQNDMKRAIRTFGEKLRGGGIGLFYYAGHGVQVKGINYLVPVDAKVGSEEEVEYECVDAGFVLAQMDSAGNSTNIVVLDACRNNPFARSFRSASRGLAQMDAPSGTLIAYATAPGSVASDGSGRNGLYTQELLKNMRMPGIGIEEVFKRVRISVRNLTQNKQTPWESSSLVGDFYFARGNGVTVPVKTQAEILPIPSSNLPSNTTKSPVNSDTGSSVEDILARRNKEKEKDQAKLAKLNEALYTAVREGYLDIVEASLKEGANPNYEPTFSGSTVRLIALAAKNKRSDIVRALFAAGADPFAYDSQGDAVFYLIKNNDVETLSAFVTAKVNFNRTDVAQAFAYSEMREKVLEVLIQGGLSGNLMIDTSSGSYERKEPLISYLFAFEKFTPALLGLLIKAGANVNGKQTGDYQSSVLMKALDYQCKNLETIKMLVDAGADVNYSFVDRKYKYTVVELAKLKCPQAIPILRARR
jgi:hypothetical protein